MGRVGLLGQDKLKVVAQGGFNRGDVARIRNTDAVGERSEGAPVGLESREGAAAESFVTGFELFEDVQA